MLPNFKQVYLAYLTREIRDHYWISELQISKLKNITEENQSPITSILFQENGMALSV